MSPYKDFLFKLRSNSFYSISSILYLHTLLPGSQGNGENKIRMLYNCSFALSCVTSTGLFFFFAYFKGLFTQSSPTLCYPMDCSPPGSCPWNSPGKKTGVGCHFLLPASTGLEITIPRLLHKCD